MASSDGPRRSDSVKKGLERAPHRALLRALGITDDEMSKPFIGVVNSYNEIIPGHTHLRLIAEAVKAGVRGAGGTPFEFNVLGVDDGIAMGHIGMQLQPAQPRAHRRLRWSAWPSPTASTRWCSSPTATRSCRACSWRRCG